MFRTIVAVVASLALLAGGPVRADSSQKSGSSHASASKSSGSHASHSTPKSTKRTSTSKAKTSTTASKSHATHTSTKASKSSTSTTKANHHSANYCESCLRDSHGRILRSDAATNAFKAQTGYPKGRPGYVIDHIVPLACGGKDNTSNMQWQTVAAAKAKDGYERSGCAK